MPQVCTPAIHILEEMGVLKVGSKWQCTWQGSVGAWLVAGQSFEARSLLIAVV
jgi:hypothetical protein